MRFMVSYQQLDRMCGNMTFDTEFEANLFIVANRHNWLSHSVFTYQPHWSGVTPMSLVQPPEAKPLVMIPGYCHAFDFFGARAEEMETEVYTPTGWEEVKGQRNIDGSDHVVFHCPDGRYRAQTCVSLGCK